MVGFYFFILMMDVSKETESIHVFTKTVSLHKTYTSLNKVKSQHRERKVGTKSHLYSRSYLSLMPTVKRENQFPPKEFHLSISTTLQARPHARLVQQVQAVRGSSCTILLK